MIKNGTTSPTLFLRVLVIILALVFLNQRMFAAHVKSPRERISLDFGWKFHLGDNLGLGQQLDKAGQSSGPAKANFNDFNWRRVDLPHDWVVELPFDPSADCNHGFKPVGPGFLTNDVAWYRRIVELPRTDESKRLWLEFDGVYRDCDVFVNGWFVGHHEDGYDSFRFDITEVANCGGKNVVAVKVNASQFEGWFYEGAGIYRHVWLVKTSPLAIAPDGIFVYSKFKDNFPKGAAEIHVETSVLNQDTNATKATVTCEVISPAGTRVAKFKGDELVINTAPKSMQLKGMVSRPVLWSPESPKLYKLVTTVESRGQIVDRQETEFGIRTVAYNPNEGFLLNGKHYEIQGTCNHQDAAGVGAAVPDAMQYFRIAKLKEMGCNAYRTSHNAPTPELLEACDRLGMLVLDENRLFGYDAANLERLKGQILRDRNHPSVFTWSLGNEEWNPQDTATGAAVTRVMQNLVNSLDPTRQCTLAVNSGSYGDFGIFSALEVKGFNYHYESMDAYHAAFPTADILGTEQASSIGTRGIYTNDASLGYVSAYDDHNPRWGCSAEEWWSFFATRAWASGGFDWTGFDYRGEPTPYKWPCISSHFGILDTCGFPKDNFWYYQSWWTTNIVLHLLPHWNWPGREGQEISVRALSNCREVELFLNGESLGRQTMKQNSELKWRVKYSPGTLSAKGFNDGKLVAETKVETTGAPAAINLVPDRTAINADGKDVSVFTVSAVDGQGRVVPVATNLIQFELNGPGKIIGVGNGDPTSHEPDVYLAEPPALANTIFRRLDEGWHWETVSKLGRNSWPEYSTNFDDSAWEAANVKADDGQLQENQQAVFRVRFQVTEKDLQAEELELNFADIDDDGYVFVNGRHVGDASDWQLPAVFEVKPFLHPGENTIAVGVVNKGGPGGITKGVTLGCGHKLIPPHWQRSVFNGLAQVIVQSAGEPGEIKLTASADGLVSATTQVESKAEQTGGNAPNLEASSLDDFHPVKAPKITGLFLKQGDRLAICGDSITEQKMYSRLMEDYLTMCVPQLQVSVRQYGWSGEKVPGFLGRMTNDCLRFHPTVATTCYGMNDFEYRPFENRIGQTYQENSSRMVEAFKANDVRVVLGSPGCISKVPPWVKSDEFTTEDLDLSLCQLRNLDVAVAGREKVRFADVFWPMLTGNITGQEAYGTNYGIPGNDGVHPHWAGHLVMAYAYMKALGLDGDIGTFTIDLKKDDLKATAGHKVISEKAGEYEIESSRYPFCAFVPGNESPASYPVYSEDGVGSDNSILSGMTLVPFNQELNRLMLFVKNGSASRYEVVWGNVSKIFTQAQLNKGINLAAEFPNNPFTAAFAKVDAAVAAKQVFETDEIKKRFHPSGMSNMKDIADETDRVVGSAEQDHAALVAAVEASFAPVTHTIKIVAL